MGPLNLFATICLVASAVSAAGKCPAVTTTEATTTTATTTTADPCKISCPTSPFKKYPFATPNGDQKGCFRDDGGFFYPSTSTKNAENGLVDCLQHCKNDCILFEYREPYTNSKVCYVATDWTGEYFNRKFQTSGPKTCHGPAGCYHHMVWYKDHDIKDKNNNIGRMANSVGDCQQKCKEEDSCVAFIYVLAGSKVEKGKKQRGFPKFLKDKHCYLKSAIESVDFKKGSKKRINGFGYSVNGNLHIAPGLVAGPKCDCSCPKPTTNEPAT